MPDLFRALLGELGKNDFGFLAPVQLSFYFETV